MSASTDRTLQALDREAIRDCLYRYGRGLPADRRTALAAGPDAERDPQRILRRWM